MAGVQLTKSEENMQLRQAAQAFYESDPTVSLAVVAQHFGVTPNCVEKWSARYGWTKASKMPRRGVPAEHLAMVRRATRANNNVLINDAQVQLLSYVEHHRKRDQVASHISRNLQIMMNRIMAEAANPDGSHLGQERMRKLAMAAAALKQTTSELRKVWRLDEGMQPEINDGIQEMYIKQAEERLMKRLEQSGETVNPPMDSAP
ncbi:hypothetical protein H0K60_004497 [Salmonella enterica]|nr:hypothetical protein [Salmonella enterica]EFR2649739.1 hypothetical protein [Salmonella enterica]EFS1408046.1 hypothetical protein [Salmonella enterica]EHQ8162536.1 hypothetical protein [Salmonella enterica]EJZ9218189.1 hypothetical protein [Salmonella enterica]